ncbi:triose-phosphate isomerase [Salinibacter altiplanensis]|uniref:triose-phosphate isomerase n=1 Tax=Salinibacter altiplanensis TaxID=1803181 RepID=UPI000C9FA8EA|nr:triose-phosphate isomerase [Salinibacter altiplanensis]
MLVAGNWKMNTDVSEGRALADAIAEGLSSSPPDLGDVDVLVCPPYVHLPAVLDALAEVPVTVGAQDMHAEGEGAYTGDVSAPMLASIGCDAVILGHSERREYYDETDADVNAKAKQARAHGLVPIVCVGETLEERQAGEADTVVQDQVDGALSGVSVDSGDALIVAYEPIWAIGTGESAAPAQAQEMHAVIRDDLTERYGANVADDIPLLYGGSMKPHNAYGLLSQPDIDGGLIGSASLAADSFLGIAEKAVEVQEESGS